MGIEPTPTAWKAVVLAVILHPRFEFSISYEIVTYSQEVVKYFFGRFLGRCCLFLYYTVKIRHSDCKEWDQKRSNEFTITNYG